MKKNDEVSSVTSRRASTVLQVYQTLKPATGRRRALSCLLRDLRRHAAETHQDFDEALKGSHHVHR